MRSVPLLGRGLALAAVLVLAAAGPSYAGGDASKSSSTSGSSNPSGNLGAGVQVTYTTSGGGGSGSQPIRSVDTNWTPPPCWIGPIAGAKEFKNNVEQAVKNTAVPGQANYALQAMDEFQRHYSDGFTWDGSGQGYKDFNVDQDGKGMFWGAIENPESTSVHRGDCNGTIPFWVPNGQLPPPGTPDVITPDMLSKLAYAHTRIPGVTIETSPTAGQTVNLPTWVWLRERYTPVSVRASINLGGGVTLWAETTAKATSVRVEPGTQDATLFPASGECPVAPSGQVGARYPGHTEADPPCGVTYLRSTAGTGPYQLNVTAQWTVTWTGSGGTGGTLPSGVMDNPRPVTVQEIQAVNR